MSARRLLPWLGVAAAPLAWGASTQLGQILPYADCGGAPWTALVAGGAMLLALLGSALAQSGGRGFVLRVGAGMGVILAFALGLQALAALAIDPCAR